MLAPTRRWILTLAAIVVSAGLIPALAWVATRLFPIAGQQRVARVRTARS